MSTPKPKLRWFQFSLRTLLVFVTLCAIPCSWLAIVVQQAKRERAAVATIEKLGGRVVWTNPIGPVWLRSVLGNDFGRSVEKVYLQDPQVTDADLEPLKGLR